MRPNLKVLGLALAVVMALGAITAGAAQGAAPRWKVEGAFLGAGATKAFKAVSETTATLAIPNLGVPFDSPTGKCTVTGEIEGSGAGIPGTVTAASLTCTEVIVEGGATCKVHSPGQPTGTVKTNTLAGTLVWLKGVGSEAGVLLKPAGGTELANITVEGCAAAGPYPVTKEVIGALTPVEQEVETGTLDFPSPPILKWWSNATPFRTEQTISQLRTKNQPATFDTTFSIELNPKEAAGVFPG